MNNFDNSFSSDNFTEWVEENIEEFSGKIYDIDDGISSIEDSEEEIIRYLTGIRCSLSLGMAIRRYLCGKFASKTDNGYRFVLQDGSEVSVQDYMREDYSIENDDIKEYTSVFYDVYMKYNPDLSIPKFNVAEARRLLRVDSACQRKKMFEISFALHVNPAEMNKFLTDVLAVQTYNYRDPYEIIAYFCHSQEEYNSYAAYIDLVNKYKTQIAKKVGTEEKRSSYTAYAMKEIQTNINSERELFKFLSENQADFIGFSQTAYNEFRLMYDKVCEKVRYQRPTNDDYLHNATFSTVHDREVYEDRVSRSVKWNQIDNSKVLAKKLGVPFIGNPEQLAYAMLSFIPRATFKKQQDGKTVVSADFISISNGESGQKSKKVQTTKMPKDITMNLLMRDRLDDLLLQNKQVERKDLVFLKFFLFALHLRETDSYSYVEYLGFKDECNDMLLRCGMSRLYAANRFENLILLSLLSSRPFEMFEDIIEYSFINEPEPESADEK